MWAFAVVTVIPFLLIVSAALAGGVWVWLALGYMTVLVALMDRIIGACDRNRDPQAEFPAAELLLVCLGVGHFGLLALAIWAVGGTSGLTLAERVGVALAAGMVFGQISHPAAHELIHRQRRALRRLGRLIYTSLLIGHHASAHLLVHHLHVGTDTDPSSAPRGMGFYRFAGRAWRGAFLAGLAAENRRRQGRNLPLWQHPYALYLGGGALMLILAAVLAGAGGVLALLIMAAHAQLQIQMSDYVQHYGLRRQIRPDGRAEPVGPQHSWNSPHVFSAALSLNAPRHSDHHVTPSRPYPALQLEPETMPCLPRPLPVMAALALVPPVWFRMMDLRCERWQNRASKGKSR
ncbi:alkane 1-monooxygenase [Roseovarius amoyensis]|uniref:alkane 1-monooxygenase n=1 Tax=Roseovarius amoyensis TaxID=2211448 RepID=UPI000DBE75F7|nr:alkane 1-monooxygenase [Roseovarius amoyensis]